MSYIVLNGKLVKIGRRPQGGSNLAEVITARMEAAARAQLKGKQNGNCNVTACQRPGATWWNTSTRAYYCYHCASEINRWSKHDDGFEICYPSYDAAITAKARFT